MPNTMQVLQTAFHEYYEGLHRYAFSLTGDDHIAQDAVLHVFLSLLEKRDQLVVRHTLRSHLYRAVHHNCRNLLTPSGRNGASPEEAEMIDHWLKSSSANVDDCNRLWSAWSASGNGTPYKTPDPAIAWTSLRNRLDPSVPQKPQQPRVKRVTPLRVWFAQPFTAIRATQLLLIAGALTFAAVLFRHRLKHDLSTAPVPTGHTYITLSSPDAVTRDTLATHAVVTMDQQTTIQYDAQLLNPGHPPSGKKRESITLLSGTAYIQGKPGDSAFDIKASGLDLRAAGASYLVSLDTTTGAFTLRVFAGEVQLADQTVTRSLEAGYTLAYDLHSGYAILENAFDSNSIAFSTGIYSFRDATMDEITDILTRSYRVNIHFRDPTIGNCRITERFDNLSIDQVMDIITATLGFTYTKADNGKTITIDGHGCY